MTDFPMQATDTNFNTADSVQAADVKHSSGLQLHHTPYQLRLGGDEQYLRMWCRLLFLLH